MKNKLGDIFGESITSQAKFRRIHQDFHNNVVVQANFWLFILISIIILTVILSRLIYLTEVKGNYFAQLSSQNRIRENIFPAPRGVILDRKGQPLVINKPAFVTEISCGEKKCLKKISHDEALKLESKGQVNSQELGIARDYLDPETFSHVLGLTGYIQKEEIGSFHCSKQLGYEDEIGRSGIEKAFDCRLQGLSGKQLIEVDAGGNYLRTLSEVKSVAGETLKLALDKDLSLKTKEAMSGKTGAVIVHIPSTGEILVLYSSPTYNLDKFIEGISESEYQKLLDSPQKPLFNRAIAGVYPPGSTIKPLIAGAALEEKVITRDTLIDDTGVIQIGAFSFPNWYYLQYGKTEGQINVVTALKRSNDIYFYKVGELLGIDKIKKWENKFYLGKKLGIEIDSEEIGLVPDNNWKESVKGEKWYLGDTYHVAIGQGDLLVTPLQIAFANGVIANKGTLCRPTLLKTDKCDKLADRILSQDTIKVVQEGMQEACSAGGTAFPFFDFKVNDKTINVACKTGTAEIGDPKDLTHAWFIAYAPVENPQIAVTVLVEKGGEGSYIAAPIAKTLMEEWFKR